MGKVCKHCGSTVEFDGRDWIHDDGFMLCGWGRGTYAEPFTLETPEEVEGACAHCGFTVLWNEDTDSWVHDDGVRHCPPSRGRNPSVATLELEIENPVESNSRSEIGSGEKMGQKNGSLENGSDEAQPSPKPGGTLTGRIIALHHAFHTTVLPVHQKLKAFDALNTLLKIAVQEEARIKFADESINTQDDVYGEEEWS